MKILESLDSMIQIGKPNAQRSGAQIIGNTISGGSYKSPIDEQINLNSQNSAFQPYNSKKNSQNPKH